MFLDRVDSVVVFVLVAGMCVYVVYVLGCSSRVAFGRGSTFVQGDSVSVFDGRVVFVVDCVWFHLGICLGVDG